MTQWDGGPLFPCDSLTHRIIIKQQHVNLDCTRVIGLTRFGIKLDFLIIFYLKLSFHTHAAGIIRVVVLCGMFSASS